MLYKTADPTMCTRTVVALLIALLLPACASMYVTQADIQKLEQGMTERQVVNVIGRPTDINRTRTQYGTRAQFVYSNYGGQYESAYVYFEGGALTSIQY